MSDKPTFNKLMPMLPSGKDIVKIIAFYEAIGFATDYQTDDTAIISKDNVTLMLTNIEDQHVADNTALRIQVDHLETYYDAIKDLDIWKLDGTKINTIEEKPWGTTEFAIIDPAGICIAFYR